MVHVCRHICADYTLKLNDANIPVYLVMDNINMFVAARGFSCISTNMTNGKSVKMN